MSSYFCTICKQYHDTTGCPPQGQTRYYPPLPLTDSQKLDRIIELLEGLNQIWNKI